MGVWLCGRAAAIPGGVNLNRFQIIGRYQHLLELLPPICEFLLVFDGVREAFGVAAVDIGENLLELSKLECCQLLHLLVPDDLEIHMLSCRRKDGTRQGERVNFDELRLLDGKVREELSVSADVVGGRTGDMK